VNATVREWIFTALAVVGSLALIVVMCAVALGIASWMAVEITRAWRKELGGSARKSTQYGRPPVDFDG
jgi:hypothetical protein